MAGATLISRHKMDDSGFQRKARKAGETAVRMADKMKGQFMGAAKAFAGIFAARVTMGGLSAIIRDLDKVGGVAGKLEDTAENVQRLAFLATQGKSGIDVFSNALIRMNRRLAAGTKVSLDAADALGINVQQFLKADSIDQIAQLADSYQNMADKSKFGAEAMKLLDTEYRALIPTLIEGSDAIRKTAASVDVASEATVKSAERIMAKWDKMMTNFKVGAAEATISVVELYSAIGEFLPAMSGAIDAASGKAGSEQGASIASLREKAKREKAQAVKDLIAARNAPNSAADEFGARMEKELAQQKKLNEAAKLGLAIMFQVAQLQTSMTDDDKEAAKAAEAKLKVLKEQEEILQRQVTMQERLRRIQEFRVPEQNAAVEGFDAQSGLSALGEANLLKMRGGRGGGATSGLDYLTGVGMSDRMSFPGLDGLSKLGKANDPNQFRKAETEMIRLEKEQLKLLREAVGPN